MAENAVTEKEDKCFIRENSFFWFLRVGVGGVDSKEAPGTQLLYHPNGFI